MRSVHGVAFGLALLTRAPAVPPAPDVLQFTLAAPDSVRPGEPVPITLRLTNPTERPIDAYFLGRTITFDVIVRRDDGGGVGGGTIVWRRLEGAVVQGILQVRTLAPHETIEWREVWRQQTNQGPAVEPGTYVVQGVLPSDASPRRSPEVRLRIG